MSQWPDHSPVEYKGYTICKACDTILCPGNADSKCNDNRPRGAKYYIDSFEVKKQNEKCPTCDRAL